MARTDIEVNKKTEPIDDVNRRILESKSRHWNEVLQFDNSLLKGMVSY